MWEKKTPAGSGGVDDVNNKYTWCASGGCPSPSNLADGTVFTLFLATLNNGANQKDSPSGGDSPITGCFANHCDWRLPSIVELKSIFDRNRAAGCATGEKLGLPRIDPAFGPTQANSYWSATSRIDSTNVTRNVDFGDSNITRLQNKNYDTFVRADNENELRYPASITKVMTLYLLFEQLEQGRLRLDSDTRVSAYAAAQKPTTLGLRFGEAITVDDAIKAGRGHIRF
jgi:Protein of unknown function (DUF1566)/D-alanyl-D-alanine carboxypeptidase